MFTLWGSSGVTSEYRKRIHSLLQLLCPEGLPGVFSASSKQRRLNGSQGHPASSNNSSTPTQGDWHNLSAEASHLRGQLWAGQSSIVKLVSEL